MDAALVKAAAEVGEVVGGQGAGLVEADFIEHAAKVFQPADGRMRAAEIRDVHGWEASGRVETWKPET